jgi:hypothetical protein
MVERADPAEFGHYARDLRAIYDIGGVAGVVNFLKDKDCDYVQVLAAYLIGYIQETQ